MSEAPVPAHLQDHEKVLNAFGYWPAFHDAEIRSLKLDRNRTLFGEIANARLELVVHAMEWTQGRQGKVPAFNHHLVHFEFEEVTDLELSGFNHQNALFELIFKPALEEGISAPSYGLIINPAHGLGGFFRYARGASPDCRTLY
ncbi:MAG: Imm50 family immunity protein [Verrucomicrobiota bacterium]